MMRSPLEWHFDIDVYLNPIVPPSPLHRLPSPISRFLGYKNTHQRPLGNIVLTLWAFIGIFGSISIIEATARGIPPLWNAGNPISIGSLGAAAVLEFYAIESPLSQPRNAVLGQLLSALVGVGVRKLFALSSRFQALKWLATAISCASATALMAMTGTVHPPAGATALLAVADDGIADLGWLLLPILLLECVLMLAVALLVNNTLRRYPVYWWSPEEVGQWWSSWMSPGAAAEAVPKEGSRLGSLATVSNAHIEFGQFPTIMIARGEVHVPENMFLRPEERLLLEGLSQRM